MAGRNNSKDRLRSGIIDELITAEGWFALVPDKEKVKVYSCTDRETLKRGLVTMMLQENQYAALVIEAVEEYVDIMQMRELNTINPN